MGSPNAQSFDSGVCEMDGKYNWRSRIEPGGPYLDSSGFPVWIWSASLIDGFEEAVAEIA